MVEGAAEASTPWSPFAPLLEWYWKEQRPLPWRATRDPYQILVSEFMLQQTRVETVIPYYGRFLERFPTIRSLAEADLDDVYSAWAGLGYYRRARNLHRAAQCVVQRGVFPESEADLRGLPGVGDYTAAALASIVLGHPALALDGNALRVLCRYYALTTAPGSAATRKQLKALTRPQIPPTAAGDFTQAVMELGARLCLPAQPQCPACPLQSACQAFQRGLTGQLPRNPPARPRQRVELVALRIFRQGSVLLEKRPNDPFLADQWVLPWFFAPADEPLRRYQEAFPGEPARYLGQVRHGITFRDLEVKVWQWHTERPDCLPHQRFADPEARVPALSAKVLRL